MLCSFARWKGLIPAISASFAIMTSFLASFWCETISFSPTQNNSSSSEALTFGPWYQNVASVQTLNAYGETYIFPTNTCASFPSGTPIDPALKAVRAFTIIVGVIGGLMTVNLWVAPCLYMHTVSSWRFMAINFSTIITLFQGLTFLVFASSFCSDNPIIALSGWQALYYSECELCDGTVCNIISTVLWFVTGLVMCYQGPPQRPPPEPVETQTVTYQKTANPDGTTTVTQVAVVKGVVVPNGTDEPSLGDKIESS